MDHQYNIGKVTYYQDELNWQQDKQLTKLFKTALNSMENDTLTIDNALEILLKYDLLDAFFTIILKPKKDFWYYLNICKNVALFPFRKRWQNVPFETLKNSELRQIINDFFLLNNWLSKQLSAFAESIISMSANLSEKAAK